MKIYNCDICGSLIYFENTWCMDCHSSLGYLPLLDNMSSLETAGGDSFKALTKPANGALFRKCRNYSAESACNWMVPADSPDAYCQSCQLNEIIPDLSIPENREYWIRLEVAKRRLIYSLLRLGLPLKSKMQDPQNGLAFAFLADEGGLQLEETKKVMIGHEQGRITINIAEANDAIREKMRLDLNERYRTLLGHFRHEIGHYYWFLLIENNPELLGHFRNVFGDEQVDYASALQNYYAHGAPGDWNQHFVSGYASAHPWEDWAESWAHYLHMFDMLETARAWGLTVKFKNRHQLQSVSLEQNLQTFEGMKDLWMYLSSALNSLNRSMGMKDIYPFVWSEPVMEKLRFVQQVINTSNSFRNPGTC
ncbi:MAG: putative zinc-binding peptidase [Candidatus Omnitrophica bacterium]|nr:putative zinc-binding peptidase [Candidatus Omnitrophota bacterium]